jgi:hypothetical protein
MTASKTNIGKDPLRWSLLAIQRELHQDRATIQARMVAANIEAGPDGLWSSLDVFHSLMGGNFAAERLRTERARSKNLELKNAEMQNHLIPAIEVYQGLKQLFAVLKAEILGNSNLDDDAKNSLLSHLSEFKTPRQS